MFFLPLFDDNPIKKIPWVTYTIIGLNVLVFLFQSSLSSSELEIFFRENGFISEEFFSNSSLLYSNLYTSLFIHGGFFHLFSNMLYLWIFGDNIEAELGSIKFLIFYLVCGVIASLAQGIVDPDSLIPLIGASGAVAGILGAYLILYSSANVRVFVWIFIFIQITILISTYVHGSVHPSVYPSHFRISELVHITKCHYLTKIVAYVS